MNFAQTGPVDRVAEALSIYAIQEAQAIAANPASWRQDTAGLALKQHFYEGITAASYTGMTKAERQTLLFVRHHIRRMRATLHPTWWRRIAYNPASIFIRDVILRRRQAFRQMEGRLRQTMRGELRTLNLHSAQQALSAAGFWIPMESVLRKMMNLDMPHFHFRYSDPTRCKNAEFVLHFEQIPQSDYYRFHSFDAISLPTHANQPLQQGQQLVRQSFRMEPPAPMFTAEEAAVLVNGGYVARNDEGRESWIGLDPASVNSAGPLQFASVSFDLEKMLGRLPLAALKPPQLEKLKAGLRTGQSRTADLVVDGRLQRCKLQVKPAESEILVLDMNGRKLDVKDFTANHGENTTAAQTLRVVTDIGQSRNPGLRPLR